MDRRKSAFRAAHRTLLAGSLAALAMPVLGRADAIQPILVHFASLRPSPFDDVMLLIAMSSLLFIIAESRERLAIPWYASVRLQ